MLFNVKQKTGPKQFAGCICGAAAAVTVLQCTSVQCLVQREGKTVFCNFMKEEFVI